jgi:hypothetical protein
MTANETCPCEGLDHPKEIYNPVGHEVIRYRVGEFADFRAALLQYAGETSLRRWRPHAEADLAVQVVEWWAYLADILTFYNERAASQAYLRTADRPESPARLVRILGYRPRPGLAASGKLAALLNRPVAVTLPKGFQIASKPAPGKQPQIFETTEALTLKPPDAIAVDPASDGKLVQREGKFDGVLLVGVVNAARPGDQVLLLSPSASPASIYLTVAEATKVMSPRGQPNTRITFTQPTLGAEIEKAPVDGFQLVKGTLSAHIWPFNSTVDIQVSSGHTVIHLDGLARQIKAGGRVLLLDTSGAKEPLVPVVLKYEEAVWIANTTNPGDPSKPGTLPDKVYPIPIPHTQLTLDVDLTTWQTDPTLIEVRYQFVPVGRLIAAPADRLVLTKTPPPTVVGADRANLPLGVGIPVETQGGDGAGFLLTGDSGDGVHMSVSSPPGGGELSAPLTALFALFDVSRGATVANEVLGSGDSTQIFQDFTLRKTPVTYFYAPGSASGRDFRSTVRVWVDQVEWTEKPSFFNQLGSDQIFITKEDEQGRTHVVFGDGTNGARLPSGQSNVVASYRYGGGADSPAAGSLSVVMKPQPGLKAVRNPVGVGGGADPDSPKRLRTLAPRSVLALGRAVSADDFAVIASQAPGVAQARAYWSWDASLSRSLVKVYVIGDDNAVASVQSAVSVAADPNRTVRVVRANQHTVNLSLTIDVDPRYILEIVRDSVAAVLDDPESGLFSFDQTRIGDPIFDSAIYNACLSVAGVVAVPLIQFAVGGGIDIRSRHDPREGGYFALVPSDLRGNITTQVWSHGG